MAAYRKKVEVVEATQWLADGDHPLVTPYTFDGGTCRRCMRPLSDHGWCLDVHMVCPGDFIITDAKGKSWPCHVDIFANTFEPDSTAHHAQLSEWLTSCDSVPLADGSTDARRAAMLPHVADAVEKMAATLFDDVKGK